MRFALNAPPSGLRRASLQAEPHRSQHPPEGSCRKQRKARESGKEQKARKHRKELKSITRAGPIQSIKLGQIRLTESEGEGLG